MVETMLNKSNIYLRWDYDLEEDSQDFSEEDYLTYCNQGSWDPDGSKMPNILAGCEPLTANMNTIHYYKVPEIDWTIRFLMLQVLTMINGQRPRVWTM